MKREWFQKQPNEEAQGRKRRFRVWQRVFAVLLCTTLLYGLANPLLGGLEAKAAPDPVVVADPSTMYNWAGANYTQSTRNVGRVWTDKSVLTEDSIILSSAIGEGTGDTIYKTSGAEFMVALSALSSTSTKTAQVSTPLDIVLLLDVSGSMAQNNIQQEQTELRYEAVYNPSTWNTYYIQLGDSYQSVSYSSWAEAWRYGSYGNYTEVTPKTSAQDGNANRVQFYSQQEVVIVPEVTRMEALQEATTQFVEAAAAINQGISDPARQHRISLVKFAGSKTTSIGNDRESSGSRYNYTQIVSKLTTDLTAASGNGKALTDWISELQASGGTRIHYGLDKVAEAFQDARADARKVLIIFTDGEPNNGSDFDADVAAEAVNDTNALKDDTLVYTVGVLEGADVNDLPANTSTAVNIANEINYYMHGMSSNFPNAAATTSSPYRVTLGDRAENSDYYKVASDSQELNDIFTSIFEEISSGLASPTLVEDGKNATNSGYVTFTDHLGPFMELKGFDGLTYEGRKVGTAPAVTAAEGVQTYHFTGTIPSPNPLVDTETVDLSHIIITVTPGATAGEGQTVTVQIPASMLPLRYYNITDAVDTTADTQVGDHLTITETYPMRLFYSVGLRDDVKAAMSNGRYDQVEGLGQYMQTHTDANGDTHFYSNWWTFPEGERQDTEPQWGRGGAISAFTPALSNNFYYYVEDTPLYVKDGESYKLLKTEPAHGDTLYYNYIHYGMTGDGGSEVITNYVDFTYDTTTTTGFIAPKYVAGSTTEISYYYIKGGTPKIKLSNAAQFRDQKTENPTDTAGYAMWPYWENIGGDVSHIQSDNFLGNNGRISYVGTGALEISKTVTVPENSGLTAPDVDFSFQISGLPDGDYSAAIREGGSTTNVVVTISGTTTVTLKAGQTLDIYGIEVGQSYTVKEVDLPKGFTQVLPENSGICTGAITAGQAQVAAFTNQYDVTPGYITQESFPRVIKRVYDAAPSQILPENWDEDWNFIFTFSAASDTEPMPAGPDGQPLTQIDMAVNKRSDSSQPQGYPNGRTNAFDLTDILFTKAGTYVYYLSEKAGTVPGMNYTPAQYKLVVEVTDNGQGALVSDAKLYIHMDDNGDLVTDATEEEYAVFHNLYDLDSQTEDLEVYKQYEDLSGALPSDEFTFVVEATGPNAATAPLPAGGTALTQGYGKQAVVTGTNTVPFGVITFTADHVGSTYTYKVYEVDSGKPGMNYDPAVYTATVVVGFEKLDDVSSAVTTQVTWLKDGQPYTPTEYEPTYFENTYDPTDATAALQVQKDLTGRNWKSGDSFTFTLAPVTEGGLTPPMPENAAMVITNGSTGTGSLRSGSFGPITYDKVGTYRYTLTENAGALGGVTYASNTVNVTVNVTLNEQTGALETTVYYDGNAVSAAAFENTYTPAKVTMVPAAINVSKQITGRDWITGDRYDFTLLPDVGSPAPGATAMTIRNKDTVVSFDSGSNGIVFEKAGTYSYYVVEDAGSISGMTYDRTVWRFTVVVTDDQEGSLVVSGQTWAKAILAPGREQTLENVKALTYTNVAGATAAAFVNEYHAADTLPLVLTGTKSLLGRDALAGETFTFTLALAGGDVSGVTIPEGIQTVVLSDAKEGSNYFAFGGDNAGITFSKTGTYSFNIRETPGDAEHMHYSAKIATVTVEVTDPGTGRLVAQVADTDYVDQTTFINHYYTTEEAKDVLGAPEGEDSIRPAIDGQLVGVGDVLTYTIRWENAEDAPADVTIVDTIPQYTAYVEGSAATAVSDGVTAVEPVFAGGKLTWTLEAVPAHGSVTVSFQVTVLDSAGGKGLRNSAFINNVETNAVVNPVPGKSSVNDTAAAESRDTVRVGDEITYTISYKNTADTAATITITDILNPGLTYVSSPQQVQYTAAADGQPASLVWTVENVASGAEGTVSFTARVNEKALGTQVTNQATISNSANTKVVPTNKDILEEPETTSLRISKEVLSAVAGVTAPVKQFDFHLTLRDPHGNILTESYPWTSPQGTGTITGCDGRSTHSNGQGILSIYNGGWYVIQGLPVGAIYQIEEMAVPAGFRQTGPVDDDGVIITEGVLVAEAAQNVYEAENTFTPATVTGIQVGKQVVNQDGTELQWLDHWVFAFNITGQEAPAGVALPMPAQTQVVIDSSDADQLAAFGDIQFTAPGRYTYTITENRTFTQAVPSLPGITYSQAAYLLTVTVTEAADGSLEAATEMIRISLDEDGVDPDSTTTYSTAMFRNLYQLESASWVPSIRKTMVNSADASSTNLPAFAFVIQELRSYSNGAARVKLVEAPFFAGASTVGGIKTVTRMSNAAGQVDFGSLVFTQDHVGKTYEYLVREDPSQTADYKGVTYDTTRYIVKIAVTEQEVTAGQWAVHAQVSYHQAVLSGVEWIIGDAVEGLYFNNNYSPEAASVSLQANKELLGRAWLEGEYFTLELTPALNTYPMPLDGQGNPAASLTETVTEAAPMAIFDAIEFTQVGEYGYFLREVVPTQKLGGLTYDENLYLVWIKVTDSGAADGGKLNAQVDYYLSNAEKQPVSKLDTAYAPFVNRYETEDAVLTGLEVEKIFAGRPWKQTDAFTFTLAPKSATDLALQPIPVGDIPMPAQAAITVDAGAAHADKGQNTTLTLGQFGAITYTRPGIYLYTLQETQGTIPGVSYDDTVYTVAVTVVDNYEGQLEIREVTCAVPGVEPSVLVPAASLRFTNTYKAGPTGGITVQVRKDLVGRDWKTGDRFTFALTPLNIQGTQTLSPMPVAYAPITIGADTAGHTAAFADIVFDRAGVYEYQITEVIPATPEERMTYDGHVTTVRVVVVDADGSGKLTATLTYFDQGHAVQEHDDSIPAVFTNLYFDPADAKSVADGSGNTLNGKAVSAGQELTYTIQWAAIAPAGGDGKVADKATVTVTDTLPEGLIFVDGSTVVTGTDTQVRASKQTVGGITTLTYVLADQPIGASGTISFKVKVTAADTDGQELQNKAMINGYETNTTYSYLPGKAVAAAEQSQSLTNPQIGQKLSYTIRYYHPGNGVTMVITDTLSQNLDFVSATESGIHENGVITWNVTSKAGDAAAWKTVRFEATLNKGAVQSVTANDADIQYPDHTVTTNEVTVDNVKVTDLQLSKTVSLTADQGLTMTQEKLNELFTFQVILKDLAGKPLTGTFAYTVNSQPTGTLTPDAQGMVTLSLKHSQSALISGLPVGTVYTVTETDIADGYESGKTANTVSGALNSTAMGQVSFVNTYGVSAAQQVLQARKVLEGPQGTDLSKHTFSFGLYTSRTSRDPVATATCDASGNVVFEALSFTKAGTYNYILREITTSSTRYAYDNTAYLARVTVTDQEDGTLKATVAYSVLDGAPITTDYPVFTNTFNPDAKELSVSIAATKKHTGWDNVTDWQTLVTGKYSFGLYDSQNNLVATANNAADGSVRFENVPVAAELVTFAAGDPSVDFTASGVGIYTFTMKETIPTEQSAKLPGVDYDETVYTVVLTVVLDPETQELKMAEDGIAYYLGQGDGKQPITADQVVFTNDYEATASEKVLITGSKVLMNRELGQTKFTFQAVDASGQVKATAENDSTGAFQLDLGTFDTVGTYTYTVSEQKGDDPTIIYSDAAYTVTVTVTDNGSGQLLAEVAMDAAEGIVFTNYFTTPIKVQFTAGKSLEGKPLLDGEFQFVITDGQGQVLSTGVNDAEGKIVFEPISFEVAGQYTLYMSELVEEPVAGMDYDETEHPIQVLVESNGENHALTAQILEPTEKIYFYNDFEPLPIEVSVTASKELRGRSLKDGEFSFRITDADGKVLSTGKNDGNGKIAFAPISFQTVGTYVLKLQEVAGTAEGITYDSKTIPVTVKVTMLDDGTLTAAVTYPTDGAAFYNTFKETPDTGDGFQLGLWVALLLVSCGGLVGTVIFGKKKQTR